ncbi:MAG: hypothetical protein HYY06_19160 [Deltaproteobacteria bacterium]|nr:hypothetical protein [Deltaproteobacteria bacterium]
MDLEKVLEEVFEADRSLRAAESRLLATKDRSALAQALARRVASEREKKAPGSSDRLARLADLCAQVPAQATLDALIRILDHDDPAVRTEAGEALRDLGIDRFKDVRSAVERALGAKDLHLALEELPFVLAELGDPPSVELVARFLRLGDPAAVASGIEALAAMGDPAAIEHLRKLEGDTREVTLEEEGVGELRMTVGELAQDAIAELTAESPDDPADEAPGGASRS